MDRAPVFAPLLPPDWCAEQLDIFIAAVRKANSSEMDAAREILKTIRSDALRAWYKLALDSGTARFNALGRRTAECPLEERRAERLSAPLEREVLARDGYRCRYCCKRIVVKEAFAKFGRKVGADVFRATGNDSNRHGIVLVFRACADHVVPWNRGGPTSLENLVTACWPCNFAKSNYTLDQIGLNDPRDRPPINDEWDGLISDG